MKLFKLIALAGFAATGLAGATAAQAQDWRHDPYARDRYERRWERHERWERRHDWERGRHYGWDRGYGRRVCWTEWRYGRPFEVCRRR